jgi:DNA-binding MltR family transcriptional regulator
MEEKYDPTIIEGKALERYFDFNDALLEFNNLFNHTQKEDRSIVLVGGSFLELVLEHILRAYLPEDDKEVKKLFDYNGALGTFSSKISMAYSLGLIEKIIKDDLHYIRKIRNEFAHNLYASFDHAEVVKCCKNLQWYKIVYDSNPLQDASARDIFHFEVDQLIGHLNGCISIARTEKRTIRDNLK